MLMLMTWVNASIAPLETETGFFGDPTAVNGTTVPTSRSSRRSVTLPTVPRMTTASSLEPSVFFARYAMFALSALSPTHCSTQVPPVMRKGWASCWLIPMKIRLICSTGVSPDGRGVAAVAAIAASVMAFMAAVEGAVDWSCSLDMPTPLCPPERAAVGSPQPTDHGENLTVSQLWVHAFGLERVS